MITDSNYRLEATGVPWRLPEALQELVNDDERELVVEIIELFKDDTRGRLYLLRAAAERGCVNDVRAQAHAIQGASSQVGANSLTAVCSAIETGTGRITETLALVREAELLFDEVCALMVFAPGA
jgi:HPt (histidine-containing phosphotransfer) domain-containing protein